MHVWHKFDGLFLSNGPGDPTYNVETIKQFKRAINVPNDQVQPIFGIWPGKPVINHATAVNVIRKLAPEVGNVKDVLLLGSGGTSIGQAGEFNYSGGQAIKVRGHFQAVVPGVLWNYSTYQFPLFMFLFNIWQVLKEVVLMNPYVASVHANMDNTLNLIAHISLLIGTQAL
jgi:hypothetical protein